MAKSLWGRVVQQFIAARRSPQWRSDHRFIRYAAGGAYGCLSSPV